MLAGDRRIGYSSGMNLLNLDTLAFANRLKEAGADRRLAEAIASGLAEAKPGDRTSPRQIWPMLRPK